MAPTWGKDINFCCKVLLFQVLEQGLSNDDIAYPGGADNKNFVRYITNLFYL
jgi:hypothetical protein